MQSCGLLFSLYLNHYQHNTVYWTRVFYFQNISFQALSGHYQALYKASECLNGGYSMELHVPC